MNKVTVGLLAGIVLGVIVGLAVGGDTLSVLISLSPRVSRAPSRGSSASEAPTGFCR